jgi:dipeptide/tripeptide permease
MNREPERRLPFSPLWLVLDTVGALLLAAGVLALSGAGARFDPRVAGPQVGWTLVVVGAGLLAIAAVKILGELRSRAGARSRD